jgi:FdhD protein
MKELMNNSQFPLKSLPVKTFKVNRWSNNHYALLDDYVAEEMPIGIEYNGVPHVVMLATPMDLEDFAIGFSLTEGIINSIADVSKILIEEYGSGVRIQLTIDEKKISKLDLKRQNLVGRTGCGLCGAERLAQVFRPMSEIKSKEMITTQLIKNAMGNIGVEQNLQKATGATHAAFWIDYHGDVVEIAEDVGRHNALDKLIGKLAKKREDFTQGVLLITSRASYEMVQKSIQMGIGVLIAISAPTALAIKMAEDFNLTLIGFANKENHVIYAHPERVIGYKN